MVLTDYKFNIFYQYKDLPMYHTLECILDGKHSQPPNKKVKYASTDRGHFLTEKSKDRKRKLRKGGYLTGKQADTIRRLINN